MTTTGDSVTFEYRQEIGAVLHALEDWQDSPAARKADQDDQETIKRLVSLLDAMEMAW